MANYVLLNNVDHAELRVINRYSRDTGDHKAAVLTFPTEFDHIQRELPILLSKQSNTQEFQAVALLGIQKDENLFLDEGSKAGNGWLGSYVPAIVARGPFILGVQEATDGGQQPMVYVDLEHPKISKTEGEALFLEFGGNSAHLEYIRKVLMIIQDGQEVAKVMFRTFDQLGLIEPVTIDIDLKNGDKHRLSGYFCISEEKLSNLSGADLEKLNRLGYLRSAFLMVSSLRNLERLIDIKNSRV